MATKTTPDLTAAHAAGTLDEIPLDEIDLDELRALYAAHPRDAALSKLVGLITTRRVAQARQAGEQAAKPGREAAHAEARRQALLDTELGRLEHGQFVSLLEEVHGVECPGSNAEPNNLTRWAGRPHRFRGYVSRAGSQWECNLCGYAEDARPLWHRLRGDEDG